MTALQLSEALTTAGVVASASDGKLRLTGPVPPSLLPACRLLKAALVALASGRRWWGVEASTGRWVLLDCRLPVPVSVSLLACEGDRRWDRVPTSAKLDLPHLFTDLKPATPRGKR